MSCRIADGHKTHMVYAGAMKNRQKWYHWYHLLQVYPDRLVEANVANLDIRAPPKRNHSSENCSGYRIGAPVEAGGMGASQ